MRKTRRNNGEGLRNGEGGRDGGRRMEGGRSEKGGGGELDEKEEEEKEEQEDAPNGDDRAIVIISVCSSSILRTCAVSDGCGVGRETGMEGGGRSGSLLL